MDTARHSELSKKDQSGPHNAEPGFHATLDGVALIDVVQIHCHTMGRRSVRVRHNGKVGFLHFAGGQIIHASVGDRVGEEAALEVLGWDDGQIELADPLGPVEATIETNWQGLVLRAAHQADERRAARPSKVVPFDLAGPARVRPATESKAQEDMTMSGESAGPGARLSSQGDLLSGGVENEDLAAMGAYAWEIGQMIGLELGLEGLAQIHADNRAGWFAMEATPDGTAEIRMQPHPPAAGGVS